MQKPNRKEYIVANKPGPCPDCPKYSTCKSLCEKVERWSDQDFIGKSSTVLLENGDKNGMTIFDKGGDFSDFTNDHGTFIPMNPSREAWLKIKNMRLSERVVRFIHSYYVLGKRIRDIAIEENATSQAIDRRHHHAKLCIKDRLERMDKWPEILENLTYNSVAQYDAAILFYKYSYPRRIIARSIGMTTSTVLKYISKKNKELEEKGVSI